MAQAFFPRGYSETLDPDFQMALEAEAHYGASGLMFGGGVFTRNSLDTIPEWDSIKLLIKVIKLLTSPL